MLHENDFTNPFTDKTFKTNTLFKTFQLSIRFPKYPVVSVGYHPGTQMYVINKDKIRENVYYILNGSIAYSYTAGDVHMNTAFNLNHFRAKAVIPGLLLIRESAIWQPKPLI